MFGFFLAAMRGFSLAFLAKGLFKVFAQALFFFGVQWTVGMFTGQNPHIADMLLHPNASISRPLIALFGGDPNKPSLATYFCTFTGILPALAVVFNALLTRFFLQMTADAFKSSPSLFIPQK